MVDLQQYSVAHGGQIPLSCHICRKLFVRHYSLMMHIVNVHFGIKSFPCEVYNKSFGVKSTLVRYRHIHTGDMPFSCRICHKGLFQNNKLVIHIHTCEE